MNIIIGGIMFFNLIKNLLIAIMSIIAVYGVFSINELSTLKLILFLSYCTLSLGYVAVSFIHEKKTKLPFGPNGEIPSTVYGNEPDGLTEQQVIVEGFINDVLDYCAGKGKNCTLMNEPDGLWLVDINDSTGKMNKIINLTLPNEKDVTRENVKGLLKKVCDDIDIKLNELDK